MSARVLGAGGLVLAVVLFFAVNSLSRTLLSSSRIDLTENRIYTLSEGTRAILARLEEPITLRFYYSKSLAAQVPGINTYAGRILGLLEEYRREAGGKLTLEAIDPEPFSEEEDRAVGYGLRGLPARAGQGQDLIYFGLVGTNSVDDEEVIPYFSPLRERFLEYDLTRMVHSLADPERPVVGVLGTLPVFGMSSPYQAPDAVPVPWAVVEQMQQIFDVRQLDPGAELGEDIDVLMLVHPQGFDPALLYRIDQFVLGGGKALVFVDPHSESQPSMMMGGVSEPERRSDAGPLLAAWGVELEEDTVVGDLSIAPTVQMEKAGRVVHFDYPVWMNLRPDLMDPSDIVTGELGNVTFGTAGVLRAREGATTQFLSLIRTSDQAKRYPQSAVGALSDPEALLDGYTPEGEPLTLAARVSGPARSAFPDGAPPPSDDAQGEAADPSAHRNESDGDINLIVFADADLLADHFWVQVQSLLGTRFMVPTAANNSLVINALDNLTGSSDLIDVRNRGTFLRPFERINALRREAEARFREKEEELVLRLEETEERLLALEETKQGEDALILSDAQQSELTRFREERLAVRRELRDVRRELRRSIESLEGWVKFINIGLMPILIALLGLAAGIWQLRRRRPA